MEHAADIPFNFSRDQKNKSQDTIRSNIRMLKYSNDVAK